MRLPKNPFHPGEILLEEFLKPSGTTQAAFASIGSSIAMARCAGRGAESKVFRSMEDSA